MRPRTKLQLRVANLSSQLPNIESLMIDWAKNECLKHIGYATKSRIICMESQERLNFFSTILHIQSLILMKTVSNKHLLIDSIIREDKHMTKKKISNMK